MMWENGSHATTEELTFRASSSVYFVLVSTDDYAGKARNAAANARMA